MLLAFEQKGLAKTAEHKKRESHFNAMVDVFRIELHAHQDVFFPGQTVSGRCILQLREPVNARAVVLSVVGKAETHWTESRSVTDNHGVHHTTHSEYDTYHAEVEYMSHEFVVWLSSRSDCKYIASGSYEWPFTVTLPNNCPPSFEGIMGHIRYYAQAKIVRPMLIDNTTITFFTVMPMFDMNMVPYAANPVGCQFSKTIKSCCCYSKGLLLVKASASKSGVVPGEIFFIRVEVENRSKKSVHKIEASLMQNIRNIGVYSQMEARMEFHCISSYLLPFIVSPGSSGVHMFRTFKLPPVVPSFNTCEIIQVNYSVQIRILISGTFTSDARCEIPILVGIIPTNSAADSAKTPAPSLCDLQPPSPIIPDGGDVNKFPFVDSTLHSDVHRFRIDMKICGYVPKYVYYDETARAKEKDQAQTDIFPA